MLGSPVEVRYDDGGAVVLIQADGGLPARASDGVDGATEALPTQNSQGNAAGTSESGRIIIHDNTHRVEGCGSITIVTPTNNLKISINTKRYDRRIDGFQTAKMTLTNDLRNKLGELDELLKASCEEDEDSIEQGEPSNGKGAATVIEKNQLNASTSSEIEENCGERNSQEKLQVENSDACYLENYNGEQLYLLDDVLVRKNNKNELFFLGTVIDLQPDSHCLVRFDDATIRRFALSNITRCGGSIRPIPNNPPSCSLVPVRPSSPPRMLRFPPEFFPLVSITQLPYDLNTLKWDALHRVNTAGNYCYCGDDGDWAREMLQCRRCEQWFHGRCVRSLQFPIFHGDTFYVFICSICNHGHEFVRRLVLSADDLAHVVLYNLIMRNGRRFYGLRSAILPYIEDNQRTLQLPEKFVRLSTNERADLLLNALKSNKNSFFNGKDFSLSPQLWTLQVPIPPPIVSIIIPIPPQVIVTETLLQHKLADTEHFQFLPRTYHEKNYFMDGATRERMVGLAYANCPESYEDPRTEFCVMGPSFVSSPATTTQNQSTINDPLSSSLQAAAASKDTNGLVGASRRKHWVKRPIPSGLPILGSVLDAIIPPPLNFIGTNNPFYEEAVASTSLGNGRVRYERKIGTIKRRAYDMTQRCMANVKRRKIGHSGGSFLRGAVPRTRVLRNRALSDVVEESPNTLSWDNVQRHNKEHNMNGGTQYVQQRSSATCSSSSCLAEQVDATVAAGDRPVDTVESSIEEKPLASGRRSSGRLIALQSKNYCEKRKNKRRREPESLQRPTEAAVPCRDNSDYSSVVYEDTESDQSNSGRPPFKGFTTASSESSSCALRNVYWNLRKKTPDNQQQQNHVQCTVVGKRTLPDGQQELLLEEN